MATEIKCPNCQHVFPMEEAMAEEYKKDLREKMQDFKKRKGERTTAQTGGIHPPGTGTAPAVTKTGSRLQPKTGRRKTAHTDRYRTIPP